MPRLRAFPFVAALALVVAVLAAACGGGLSEAEQHNENGLKLADEGQWEEAIAEYDQAVELDPEFASAYINRGIAYATRLGDFQQAQDDANAVFDKALDDADAAFGQAQAEAEAVFDKAFADAEAPFNQAQDDAFPILDQALAGGGDLDQATAAYNQALADPGAIFEQALADAEALRDKALAEAEAVRDKALDDAEAANKQAIADAQAEFDQAIADWEKALSLTDDADVIAVIQGLIEELGGPQ